MQKTLLLSIMLQAATDIQTPILRLKYWESEPKVSSRQSDLHRPSRPITLGTDVPIRRLMRYRRRRERRVAQIRFFREVSAASAWRGPM